MARSEESGAAFAALIKRARQSRGWTQEELADESHVGLRTVLRWESGRTSQPAPEQVRAVLLALGVDPREGPVALGLVTREEMGLPAAQAPALNPTEEEILDILRDPSVSDSRKQEWRDYLRWQYGRVQKTATKRRTG